MSNQQRRTEVVVIADAVDRFGFEMPADVDHWDAPGDLLDNFDIIGRADEDHSCDSLSDEVIDGSFGGFVRRAVNRENDIKALSPGSRVDRFRQNSEIGIEDVGNQDTHGTREIAGEISRGGIRGVVEFCCDLQDPFPLLALNSRLTTQGQGSQGTGYASSLGDIGECQFNRALVGHDLRKRSVKPHWGMQLKLEVTWQKGRSWSPWSGQFVSLINASLNA